MVVAVEVPAEVDEPLPEVVEPPPLVVEPPGSEVLVEPPAVVEPPAMVVPAVLVALRQLLFVPAMTVTGANDQAQVVSPCF